MAAAVTTEMPSRHAKYEQNQQTRHRKAGLRYAKRPDLNFPSMKRANFVDESGILNFPSMKRAVSVDGSGILYFPSMKKADFVDEKSE